MDEKSRLVAETEQYLARIRETVRSSRALVETAKLRLEETDRFLASQGLTREALEKMTVTEEQQRAVDAELKRLGFEPLAEVLPEESLHEHRELSTAIEESERPVVSTASANFTAGDGDGSVENRKRKFNVMMQQFRM